MRGHKIRFYGKILITIPKLSLFSDLALSGALTSSYRGKTQFLALPGSNIMLECHKDAVSIHYW